MGPGAVANDTVAAAAVVEVIGADVMVLPDVPVAVVVAVVAEVC